jgi:hypothetical protein
VIRIEVAVSPRPCLGCAVELSVFFVRRFTHFFWGGAFATKTTACLWKAPAKRGVYASLPAALLPVDATHVAAVSSTPAAIPAKPPAVARPTGVWP